MRLPAAPARRHREPVRGARGRVCIPCAHTGLPGIRRQAAPVPDMAVLAGAPRLGRPLGRGGPVVSRDGEATSPPFPRARARGRIQPRLNPPGALFAVLA